MILTIIQKLIRESTRLFHTLFSYLLHSNLLVKLYHIILHSFVCKCQQPFRDRILLLIIQLLLIIHLHRYRLKILSLFSINYLIWRAFCFFNQIWSSLFYRSPLLLFWLLILWSRKRIVRNWLSFNVRVKISYILSLILLLIFNQCIVYSFIHHQSILNVFFCVLFWLWINIYSITLPSTNILYFIKEIKFIFFFFLLLIKRLLIFIIFILVQRIFRYILFRWCPAALLLIWVHHYLKLLFRYFVNI